MTSNKTLNNWKREGLRVIRRRTEYVYTPVARSPFSVAIASPLSFGRYYIDLPSDKEADYEQEMRELVLTDTAKNMFFSNVQLYNCSYSYVRLSERLVAAPRQSTADYCIRYLYQDIDQVLAIKSDLVLHNIYYNQFNFSIFKIHRNLVKSSFYGTYSGITFYLPVTFYRSKAPPVILNATSVNGTNETAQLATDSTNATATTILETTPIEETTSEATTTVTLVDGLNGYFSSSHVSYNRKLNKII